MSFEKKIENMSQLSSKIVNLLYTCTDRSAIVKTFDEIREISLGHYIDNKTPAFLINQCCSRIQCEDDELAPKCAQFILNLIEKHKFTLEGITLSIVIKWCLSANAYKTHIDFLSVLNVVLQTNTDQNLALKVVTDPVITALLRANTTANDVRFQALQCLENSVRICKNAPQSEIFKNLLELFIEPLNSHQGNRSNSILDIKTVRVCLNGIQSIAKNHQSLLEDYLGVILGIVKTYMLYNVKNVEFIRPQKLCPSILSVPEPSQDHLLLAREAGRGGRVAKQRKHWKNKKQVNNANTETSECFTTLNRSFTTSNNIETRNLVQIPSTSDSDFSDTESAAIGRVIKEAGRIRQISLNILLHIENVIETPKMFVYWSNFMPDTPPPHSPLSGSDQLHHHVTTCAMLDTSARGRMLALSVLFALITSSKHYLQQAESGSQSTASFTPFSVTIGRTVHALHQCLFRILATENSVECIAQALKCLAALVQASPYHKLKNGLLTQTVHETKQFVYHKNSTVRITALMALGCVLASEPIVDETEIAFTATEAQPGKIPWILECCTANLNATAAATPPVKIESLQTIAAIASHYFAQILVHHLDATEDAINCALNPCANSAANTANMAEDKSNDDIRLHALRTINFIAQAIDRVVRDSRHVRGGTIENCTQFWRRLLDGAGAPLIKIASDESGGGGGGDAGGGQLRALACECVASIGAKMFAEMSRDTQVVCVTVMFGAARSVDGSVAGSACRTLSILAGFEDGGGGGVDSDGDGWSDDGGFLADAAHVICAVLRVPPSDDSGKQMAGSWWTGRIKAAWALATLTDVLVTQKSLQNTRVLDELFVSSGWRRWCEMVDVTVDACTAGGDRISQNGVRIIGNLCHLCENIESDSGRQRLRQCIERGLGVLHENCALSNSTNKPSSGRSGGNSRTNTATLMKVRWNACYALGNALKNSAIYELMSAAALCKSYEILTHLVVNCKNFKVRISAAAALAQPSMRAFYTGVWYVNVWNALCLGLEAAQNMEDFNEYKHRDNLIDQICATLAHLGTLLVRSDLRRQLHAGTSLNLSNDKCDLKQQIRRVCERVLPERAGVFLKALAHLERLKVDFSTELSKDELGLVDRLIDTFSTGF